MSELDYLNIARSATQTEVTWFAQVITINFAMIVAIYYFLNQAKIALRVFGFVAYLIGCMTFFGQMLIEANVKGAALASLKALPAASTSLPTQQFIGVNGSWLGWATTIVFNASFYVLMTGVFYLLFFWKKSAHEQR
jgi:lipopolysaccharide assembly outer membrane protein LptD (OstA)